MTSAPAVGGRWNRGRRADCEGTVQGPRLQRLADRLAAEPCRVDRSGVVRSHSSAKLENHAQELMATLLRLGGNGTMRRSAAREPGTAERRPPASPALGLSTTADDRSRTVPSKRHSSPRPADRRYGRCQRSVLTGLKTHGGDVTRRKETRAKPPSPIRAAPDQGCPGHAIDDLVCLSSDLPSVITEPSLLKTACEPRPCAPEFPACGLPPWRSGADGGQPGR